MTREEQLQALESLKNQVINLNKRNGIKMPHEEVINWLESTYIKFFPYDDDVYKSIKNIEI
ncbi:MAG: hypothetical protein IIZ94_03240 [Prevotella sp.]|nr:hypothetical protein [Prevotella sp.]